MRVLCRLLSLLTLSLAVVLVVVDATRTIAAVAWTFTSLAETWQAIAPESLGALRELAREGSLSVLAEPLLELALALPSWLAFGLVSLFLHALANKRPRVIRLSPALR